MAMTQRSRSVLHRGLSDLLDDEEAVGEMLSYFPANEREEPLAKADLDELASQMEIRFSQVEIRFSQVETQLAQMEIRLTTMLTDHMARFNAQLRTMVQWTFGAMVGLIGLVVAMGLLQRP